MALGSPAGRRRSQSRGIVGAARLGVDRQRSTRPGFPRGGARPANTLWLPVTAAAGVLLLLLWYAMSQAPSEDAAATAPVASALGEAASRGGPAAPVLPTVPPPPESGCTTGRTLPAGVTTGTIAVAGVERQYHLAIPQGGGSGSALPLIVNLHDRDQPIEALEQYTQVVDAGTRAGYAVVTPVGASGRWNFTRSTAVGPDDVLFVGSVLNDLTGRMCLDAKRVFTTGYSDGADMALALVCALPDRFAAVVTAAASRVPDDCGQPRASLLELHGTEDAIAPWDGGGPPATAPYDGLVAQPVEGRTERYARALGCGAERATTQDITNVRRTAWTSCPTGKDVGVLAMLGGGHTWPGGADQPELGRTVSNLSTTVVALAFFAGHPADGRTITGGGSGGTSPRGGTGATGGGASPSASATGTPGPTPSVSPAPDGTTEPTAPVSATPTPVLPSVSAAPPVSGPPAGQGAGDTP